MVSSIGSIAAISILEKMASLMDQVFGIPPLALELMDIGAIIFELSPLIFLIWGRPFWKLWLLSACLFHIGTSLLLNIHFINHIPLVLSFFLYPLLGKDTLQKSGDLVLRIVMVIAFLEGIWHLIKRINGDGSRLLFNLLSDSETVLHISLALWILVLLMGSVSTVKDFRLKYRNDGSLV